MAKTRPAAGADQRDVVFSLLAAVRVLCYALLQKNTKSGAGMRVIGIDPGLRNTGWGVIDMDGPRLRHVANGTCHSDSSQSLAQRLADLFTQINDVFERFRPDMAAVEQTFVNKDAVGTLKLGQARGIALLVPAQHGLEVGEYLPNAVKKAVVGVGHADKAQISHMVKLLLPGCEISGADAADALAIAICHAHHSHASTGLRMRVQA